VIGGYWDPSGKNMHLHERFAKTLRQPVASFSKGCQYPQEHLEECCLQTDIWGTLSAVTLKKVKFEFKNLEGTDSFKKLPKFYLLTLFFPSISPGAQKTSLELFLFRPLSGEEKVRPDLIVLWWWRPLPPEKRK
jgi:hypothetical protein